MKTKSERDLSFLYTGSHDPKIQKDTEVAETRITHFVQKRKNNTDYLKDEKALLQALNEYEQIQADYYHGTRESLYRGLQTYTSQDETIKANANKTALRDQQTFLALDFFELNIAKIDPETQKEFLKNEALAPYHYFLQRLFDNAKYNLSEAEEKIITLMTKTSYNNREQMLEEFFAEEQVKRSDSQGKITNKGFEEIMSLLASRDKSIRDKAGRIINKRCAKHSDAAEKEINSILEYKHTIDQLRGYQRPDQSRHIADDVNSDMVDCIISVTQKNKILAHRLYKLKAQLLGQKKLGYHERNVPILLQKKEKEYSFEQAVKIVSSVLGKLDPQFQEIFESMLKTGRIDAFPQKGKHGGAFHAGIGKNLPGLVFVNFTNKLHDISTLAHELGHAIHTEFVRRQQHGLYYGYGMFMAEVASTFVEDFVYQEIEKELDEQEKLSLLIQRINDFVSSCIRQISCYNFELELHTEWRRQGYVKKKTIGALFTKHMSSYMGPYVVQSKGSENRRTYRSHIRNFFYVYSYAGGILIAKAFQKKYKSDKQFIKDYQNIFLSAGKSESPEKTLSKMGINIKDEKFWQTGFEEVEEMITKAESLASSLSSL